jgi:predicted ester cyclase
MRGWFRSFASARVLRCRTGPQIDCDFFVSDWSTGGHRDNPGLRRLDEGSLHPVPDASYEIRSFAVDDARKNVAACAVFRGTHTGEGGPVPPTGKKVEADYVYVMDFDGDRIGHLTKIWNDGISLTQLGWT